MQRKAGMLAIVFTSLLLILAPVSQGQDSTKGQTFHREFSMLVSNVYLAESMSDWMASTQDRGIAVSWNGPSSSQAQRLTTSSHEQRRGP